VAKICQKSRKIDKNIKNLRDSNRLILQSLLGILGKSHFFSLSFFVPFTHGSIHRFKSCIAHLFIINSLLDFWASKMSAVPKHGMDKREISRKTR
jgi:hypothetical protein